MYQDPMLTPGFWEVFAKPIFQIIPDTTPTWVQLQLIGYYERCQRKLYRVPTLILTF